MHSIKTKITAMTVCVIVIAMVIATVFGVTAIRDIGNHDAQQTLLLLCETGQKDLDYYFQNVEQSVKTVAAYVESDLDDERISEVQMKFASPEWKYKRLCMMNSIEYTSVEEVEF